MVQSQIVAKSPYFVCDTYIIACLGFFILVEPLHFAVWVSGHEILIP